VTPSLGPQGIPPLSAFDAHFGNTEAELVADTIYGFRAWTSGPGIVYGSLMSGYSQRDGLFRSLTARHAWVPGWQKAHCLFDCRKTAKFHKLFGDEKYRVPMKSCSCGFYAYHNPAHAGGLRGEPFGVIEAKGKVLLGSLGFRAEEARIVALHRPRFTGNRDWWEKVEQQFPDVKIYRNKEKMLKDYTNPYSDYKPVRKPWNQRPLIWLITALSYLFFFLGLRFDIPALHWIGWLGIVAYGVGCLWELGSMIKKFFWRRKRRSPDGTVTTE
jgi:hypothetical protein